MPACMVSSSRVGNCEAQYLAMMFWYPAPLQHDDWPSIQSVSDTFPFESDMHHATAGPVGGHALMQLSKSQYDHVSLGSHKLQSHGVQFHRRQQSYRALTKLRATGTATPS